PETRNAAYAGPAPANTGGKQPSSATRCPVKFEEPVMVEEATAHEATKVQDGRVVCGGAQEVVCQQVVIKAEHRAVKRRCVRSHRDFGLVEDGLKVLPGQATPLREGFADALFDSPDADGLRVGIAEDEATCTPARAFAISVSSTSGSVSCRKLAANARTSIDSRNCQDLWIGVS
ncbi:hypothetical protein, partial [Nostocoides australiense]